MNDKLKKINRIVAYPGLISLVLGFAVILLLPPIFKRHKAYIVDHQTIYNNEHISYRDLDYDSESERISISTINEVSSYVNFYDKNNALSNIWNINGIVNKESLSFYDYDNDGADEAYLLSLSNDSLYLNRYVYHRKHNGKAQKRFITTIDKYYEQPDYGSSRILCQDIDNDGYKESIFSVFGKYSLHPRQLICYNWEKNTIRSSISSGVILEELKIATDKEDGNIFITGNNAITNYFSSSDSVPFCDNRAWFMVYDKTMNFAFPPIPFGESGTIIETLVLQKDDKPLFVVLEKNHFNLKQSSILCYDSQGENISTLSDSSNNEFKAIFRANHLKKGQFYAIDSKGNALLMNEKLELLDQFFTQMGSDFSLIPLNIDHDKQEEIIRWSSKNNLLTFYQERFINSISIKLPEIKSDKVTISVKNNHGKKQVSIKDFSHWYLVEYRENNIFFLQYAIYTMIFIFIFLIIYAIQKSIIIRSLKHERLIAHLKLMTLKNQIDPHFTLNALGAIGNSILKDQKNESYQNLQRFSKLIRNTLTQSDNITRTLEDEIQFVKDYINVMKIRFEDKFDFHFEIEENIDMLIQVPKMMIQSFVENAINHGLRPMEGKGTLLIQLADEKDGVQIVIKDDGIGRDNAKEHKSNSTGKGNQIFTEYLKLFNNHNKSKITYRVVDLFENRIPAGTKVVIYIPENYDYKIQQTTI